MYSEKPNSQMENRPIEKATAPMYLFSVERNTIPPMPMTAPAKMLMSSVFKNLICVSFVFYSNVLNKMIPPRAEFVKICKKREFKNNII